MNRRLQKTQLYMTLLFAAVTVVLTFFLTTFLLSRTSSNLADYVSRLISADARQISLNIDTYLDDVEDTAALLFSDEDYYDYDAVTSDLSDYQKLVREEAILAKIVDLGLMQNFSDFGVVYANDHTVGWISQVTSAMFPEGGMYEEFSGTISDDRTQSGWSFGRHENYDRLFYTKRLNENAIVVVSFYNKELDRVFVQQEGLKDLTLRLVSETDVILYSTAQGESGQPLPDSIRSELDGSTTQKSWQASELINVDTCRNGWKVIVSIPIFSLMERSNELYLRSILIAAALAVLILAVGLLLYRRLSSSVTDVIEEVSEQASQDLMTGLLNKATFTERVDAYLQEYTGKQANAFLMFDLDNFKLVNDKLGHAEGDAVIRKMAALLKEVFPEEFMIGRIGGDEFAACCSYTTMDRGAAAGLVQGYVDALFARFKEVFAEVRQSCDLSVSIGIVVEGPGEYRYDDLYQKADKALYVSKRSGKDRATFD